MLVVGPRAESPLAPPGTPGLGGFTGRGAGAQVRSETLEFPVNSAPNTFVCRSDEVSETPESPGGSPRLAP